jgi:hypothetical protein
VKVSDVLFSVVVVVLIISILCVWFYPSVQDFMAANSMWNGIKSFMAQSKAVNLDSLDELPFPAGGVVLVEIPYLEYSDEELSEMKRFVEDGGTMLLMDDYGYGNEVLAHLDQEVRFSNKLLLDPLFNYRDQVMPRITDLAPEVEDNGVKVIVLNYATTLTDVEESEIIAWSSAASFLDTDENGTWSEKEPKGPFPVAARFRSGKGTVDAIADPSIIIGGMIGRDDNYRFISCLTSYDDEQKEILFDSSHLPKAPLDISKTRLLITRESLSSPYILVGITAVIFVVVSRYSLRKGETIG